MAKVTDLNRAHVLHALSCLIDQNGHRFFDLLSWSECKINIGKPNFSGLSRASIVVKVYYNGAMSTYAFFLIYDYVKEDWHSVPCQFLSVSIGREFSASRLISIDNFKLNGLWQEEEGEAVEGAAATDSVEAVSDGNI